MTTTTTMTKPTALITGASGGIGEALAREFAKRNHNVVLIARTQARLDALATELRSAHNVEVTTLAQDLSAANAGHALANTIRSANLTVNIVVNNAGFADFGEMWKADPAKIDEMVNLNIATLTQLMREFIPDMVARKDGRIMNVASTAAFMPGPLMAVYYATKAYVLSLSEGVHEELKGTGVTVTALCPGPTETGFQAKAAMENSKLVKGRKIMDAETVARIGVDALLKGKPVVVTGLKNKFQALTPKFLPRRMVPGAVKRAQASSH